MSVSATFSPSTETSCDDTVSAMGPHENSSSAATAGAAARRMSAFTRLTSSIMPNGLAR